MRVFIAGIDGFLGWTLTVYLLSKGYEVGGCDYFLRRRWVKELGSRSVIPIPTMTERIKACIDVFGKGPIFFPGNLRNTEFVYQTLQRFSPDAIVHLGEMPSAPYSMIDAKHAIYSQINNISGTLNLLFAMRDVCPRAHMVKLGTLGEYGTPNIDIPEGSFEITYHDRGDTLPFPKQPHSFYHASKVHDTTNIQLACKLWGLRVTDIMQGVVYGIKIPEMGDHEKLFTRLDVDECFGTYINRLCSQAVIEHPLTVYGHGEQKRGFLPIQDSMQCLQIAIDNPPEEGTYRVFNQFESVFPLIDLAKIILQEGEQLGFKTRIEFLDNPRAEVEGHYYNPIRENLPNLGYEPTGDPNKVIRSILENVSKFKNRIVKEKIMPTVRWKK